MNQDQKFKILLGITGSVAAIKTQVIVDQLLNIFSSREIKVQIKVVVTENAKHFFNFEGLKQNEHITCYEDKDEWEWNKIGDEVLHIELRRWADVFIIAPLDANTMGKLANGLCDNLLTCIVRAWDVSKPLYYAPAMNTLMWLHPLTSMHIKVLETLQYKQIPPISKKLACNDIGFGAMAEVPTIVEIVLKYYSENIPAKKG